MHKTIIILNWIPKLDLPTKVFRVINVTCCMMFFYLYQVVKVVGSNISHKLRLSRVKPSDEGTYECRVIDFSDGEGPRQHRVRAYLQVALDSDTGERNGNFEALDDTKGGLAPIDSEDSAQREHAQEHRRVHGHHQEHGKRSSSPVHHGHSNQQHKAGRELRKLELDTNHSHSDCTNEPSCTL